MSRADARQGACDRIPGTPYETLDGRNRVEASFPLRSVRCPRPRQAQGRRLARTCRSVSARRSASGWPSGMGWLRPRGALVAPLRRRPPVELGVPRRPRHDGRTANQPTRPRAPAAPADDESKAERQVDPDPAPKAQGEATSETELCMPSPELSPQRRHHRRRPGSRAEAARLPRRPRAGQANGRELRGDDPNRGSVGRGSGASHFPLGVSWLRVSLSSWMISPSSPTSLNVTVGSAGAASIVNSPNA